MDTINEFLTKIFNTGDFTPRWVCGKWTDFHGWLYIISNVGVWAAYFTIPVLLFYFIKKRKDVPFQKIFIWFILFILLCGSTHLADAIMFWVPAYRVNAVMLFLTAGVSWGTVFALYKTLPKALELKSPDQLQQIIDAKTQELEITNKKLKDSEQFFRTLVNYNPNVITRIGKDLKYKFVNDAILKISQKEVSDFIGKTPVEITTNKHAGKEFYEHIKKVFHSASPVEYQTSMASPNQSTHHYSVQIIPISSEQNSVEDVLTITKDITLQKNYELHLKENIESLKQLSERLAYKKKILEDFAYIVSHNLRSPVGNLHALLELYEDEQNQEQKDFLVAKIKEVSERLDATVFDLTEAVNIRQNTEIQRQKLWFQEVLAEQCQALSVQILDTNAQITHDFEAAPFLFYPKMYFDSILLNLLTNAIKYRHPDRTPAIHFTTKLKNDNSIVFTCEDNGLGIDLKRHGHKIFGLYKTFHDHPDSKGVGLFITKNQIESLGGSITVESTPEAGTKFIIIFHNHPF